MLFYNAAHYQLNQYGERKMICLSGGAYLFRPDGTLNT